MDTYPGNSSAPSDIRSQAHGVVESIGAHPSHMAMLLMLATFQPGTYVSPDQFSDSLLTLQGHEPRQAGDLEKANCVAYYVSVLQPNGLANISSLEGNNWRTRCAKLTAKAYFIGTAVCGALLPLESTAPQDNFLETVLIPTKHMSYARTESMYRRLLEGSASSVELGEICDLPQLHIGEYIRTLVAAGVLASQAGTRSSNKAPSLTIDNTYYPHIESLVRNVALLGANTTEAEAFREKARQAGGNILRSANLVSWLLAKDDSMRIFVLPPKPALPLPSSKPEAKIARSQIYHLTSDEQKVAAVLAQGLSNKEIGARLSIGEGAAKAEVNAIMQKTGARNRSHAVALVYRASSRQASQRIAAWCVDLNLKPRQVDITKLLVLGYTDKMIAEQLVITVNTVKTYVRSILRKIGARNRTQIVGLAYGIYEPSDQGAED